MEGPGFKYMFSTVLNGCFASWFTCPVTIFTLILAHCCDYSKSDFFPSIWSIFELRTCWKLRMLPCPVDIAKEGLTLVRLWTRNRKGSFAMGRKDPLLLLNLFCSLCETSAHQLLRNAPPPSTISLNLGFTAEMRDRHHGDSMDAPLTLHLYIISSVDVTPMRRGSWRGGAPQVGGEGEQKTTYCLLHLSLQFLRYGQGPGEMSLPFNFLSVHNGGKWGGRERAWKGVFRTLGCECMTETGEWERVCGKQERELDGRESELGEENGCVKALPDTTFSPPPCTPSGRASICRFQMTSSCNQPPGALFQYFTNPQSELKPGLIWF